MADRNDPGSKSLTEQGVEDSAKGKGQHLKGHVKDAVGGLTGNKSLQAEGKADQLKGNLKDALGKVERKLDK